MVRALMRALARKSPNMVGVVSLQGRAGQKYPASSTLSLHATQDVSKIDLELNNHALDLNDTLLKTRSSKDN